MCISIEKEKEEFPVDDVFEEINLNNGGTIGKK